MHRRFALAMLTAIPLALVAGHAGAADIKVQAAAAVKEPFQELVATFGRESGNKVEAAFGPVGGIMNKIKGGERPDVIILSLAAMDDLDKAGSLVAGSRAELGRAIASVAVKKGAKAPDISTPDAFKAALLAATKVAFTDPAAGGTAGIYFAGLLQKFGIADEIKKKEVLASDGGAVAAAVANGTADLGITFGSELLPNKGVTIVGPIPPAIGLTVAYVAGVASWSKEGDAARALIGYLTKPAAKDHFKSAGL
jgi:molybdate transport system substrate-binding protein